MTLNFIIYDTCRNRWASGG